MSFKVINVNTSKKHATSACYDEQHVCAYPQTFSRYQDKSKKINTFQGVRLLHRPP